MKALFTSFHMLYCLSQKSKYFLRDGTMTIAVWCVLNVNRNFNGFRGVTQGKHGALPTFW